MKYYLIQVERMLKRIMPRDAIGEVIEKFVLAMALKRFRYFFDGRI